MACTEERRDQLAALAAGRMEDAGAADLFAHVESCPACSAELDLVADLVAARPVAACRLRPSLLPPLLAAAAVLVALGVWAPWRAAPAVAELARTAPAAVPDALLRGGAAERGEDFARGMAAYRDRDFAAAAGALARVADTRPDDALVHLYLGIARLQIAAAAAAVPALGVAADHGTGLLQERARWYLANAHLLLGDADAARGVLESLASGGGDYALDAADLLDALAGR